MRTRFAEDGVRHHRTILSATRYLYISLNGIFCLFSHHNCFYRRLCTSHRITLFLTESTRSQSPVCGHPGARHFEASPTPPSSHLSHPEEGAMGHGLTANLSISNTQTSLSADSYGNSFVSLSDSNTDSIESFDPLLLPRSASLHYSPPHSSVSLTMLLSLPPPYPWPCPSTSNESFITSSPSIPFSPSMTPNSSSSDLSFSSADSTSSSSPLSESPRQLTHLMQPPFG